MVVASLAPRIPAQDAPLVVRPGPPALDDFETDADGDGVPDGWYNLRDATLESAGGAVGPACLRFDNALPGRPARASRAFGIDGREHGALILGVWVRVSRTAGGERNGEDPGLVLDILDESINPVARATLGPWHAQVVGEGRWRFVSKRIPIPETSRDAILSVGLLGATGSMWIDGMSFTLEPRAGVETSNLVLNGDAELGDPKPDAWNLVASAHRVSPGYQSHACIELPRAGAQAQAPVAVPVRGVGELAVSCVARGNALRASGGATAAAYFVDDTGRALAGAAGAARVFRFSGTFAWQPFSANVSVPSGAVRAVIQFEKTDSAGTLWVDDLVVSAARNPASQRWLPYHNASVTDGWHAYTATPNIEPGTALDASGLLAPEISDSRRVSARGGHLVFGDGSRARLFGAMLLPPLAVGDSIDPETFAENVARRGINLVRIDDLDTPLGPGLSLVDDNADDTSTLDPEALARFDHLVAALKRRGVFISISLNGARRLRGGDGVANGLSLPPGGGPAAAFDPQYAQVILRFARNLLDHVNPHTGLALRDDPVLAWITISGENSLFDLIDAPNALPEAAQQALTDLIRDSARGSGRAAWQSLESRQWQAIASELRTNGVRCPIAGCAHWRTEPEFLASQHVGGLDLNDVRLYPIPTPFASGHRRGLVWDRRGGLTGLVTRQRASDRPFVVSQWCEQPQGLWALPNEGAALLLAAAQAATADWDALVRRGVFFHPRDWGAGAPGTSGGSDLFPMVEALNANPAAFALLPHAASVFLRRDPADHPRLTWDPANGRLAIETRYTRALSATADRRPARLGSVTLEISTPGATVAVSSFGDEPIESANRLLVTAVARVEPTGLTYADVTQTMPANPGRPPLLCEPVSARLTFHNASRPLRAYALDNAGRRVHEVSLGADRANPTLSLEGTTPGLHWEITAND